MTIFPTFHLKKVMTKMDQEFAWAPKLPEIQSGFDYSNRPLGHFHPQKKKNVNIQDLYLGHLWVSKGKKKKKKPVFVQNQTYLEEQEENVTRMTQRSDIKISSL